MCKCTSSTRFSDSLAPRLRGEGWGEGLSPRAPNARRVPLTRRCAPTSPRKRGEVSRQLSPNSHPEQPRIARPDLFRHGLDAGSVLLHQLDVGKLAASRFRRYLRVNRILRGVVDEELLGLARVQPGLKQLCGVGVLRGFEDAGRARDRRRAFSRCTPARPAVRLPSTARCRIRCRRPSPRVRRATQFSADRSRTAPA